MGCTNCFGLCLLHGLRVKKADGSLILFLSCQCLRWEVIALFTPQHAVYSQGLLPCRATPEDFC